MAGVWLVLGLAVALLMNWSFAGRGFVRALLAIPWAVPDIPVVLAFLIMMDPNFGILNRFATIIPGVHHHIQWFSAPTLAFIAIIMMVGWKGFPFFALIILSSLQTIPDDLYEAAEVDGAGAIRRFRSITFPALVPTLALLAVLAFIFSFQQFSIIYLSTGGGPGTDTSTLAVTIYLQAFEFFNYNYASAIAVVGLFLALCRNGIVHFRRAAPYPVSCRRAQHGTPMNALTYSAPPGEDGMTTAIVGPPAPPGSRHLSENLIAAG